MRNPSFGGSRKIAKLPIVPIPPKSVKDIREDDDTFHTIVGLHDIFITCYKNREMLSDEGLPGNK